MKHPISLAIAMLLSLCAISQFPRGLPTPFSNGYSRWGYLQSDSGIVQPIRDTNFKATKIGLTVKHPTTLVNYTWTGARWINFDNPAKRASIDWFGANGTDTLDDAPAIQAAINAGDILIPKGVYIVKTRINIPSNRSILGEGRESIIKVNNSFDNTKYRVLSNSDIINGNDNIAIDNIAIDLQNVVIASLGLEGRGFISMEKVSNLTLNRIYTASNYNGQIPIWLWDAKHLKITNCNLFNNVVTGEGGCIWVMSGRNPNVTTDSSFDINLSENTLKSNVDECISLLPVYGKVHTATVTNNVMTSIGTFPTFSTVGNRITGSIYAKVYNVEIYGNTINQGWVNIGSGASNINFHDNVMNGKAGLTGVFAFFSDVTHQLSPSLINLHHNKLIGYQVALGLNTTNSSFSDNVILNSVGYAIDASGYEASNIIYHNTITKSPIGIRVGQRGWKIINNILDSVTDGIILSADYSNSYIDGNSIKNNTGTALLLQGDSGVTYNNIVINNNTVQGAGAGIGFNIQKGVYSINNVFSNNKAYNNGVDMYNFGGWNSYKNVVTNFFDPYTPAPEIIRRGNNHFLTSGNLGVRVDTPMKELHIRHGDLGGLLIQYGSGNSMLIDANSMETSNADSTPNVLKINKSGGNVVVGSSTVSNQVERAKLTVYGQAFGYPATQDSGLATRRQVTDTLNARMITVSATLDFPSTAAGTSSELTITVTGAADGDAVSLGVINASYPANSEFIARVSASGVVAVRFNNYSTSAIDPASGIFKVKVLK